MRFGLDLVQDLGGTPLRQFVVDAFQRGFGAVTALVDIPRIVLDGVLSLAQGISRATNAWFGTGVLQASLTSNFSRGLADARARGQGNDYAINAALNAGSLGLFGLAQSLGTAIGTSINTGDASPLLHWAGGAAVDAFMLSGLLGEAGAPAGCRRRRWCRASASRWARAARCSPWTRTSRASSPRARP